MTAERPVLVGIDGSDSSLDAVELAAFEAASRQLPLRIVHAFIWPLMHVPLGPLPGAPAHAGLRNAAESLVSTAVERARKSQPDIVITSDIVTGPPCPVLLAAAADAALVVLGNRELGAFSGAVVGSVTAHLATHAKCPIVVCRGNPVASPADRDKPLPVVVGVNGSPGAAAAVGFAAAEAKYRDTALVALHASTHPSAACPTDLVPVVYDAEVIQNPEMQLLAANLRGLREDFPDLQIQQRVARSRPARALVAESAKAQLLVVGARGHGRVPGPHLGTVSAAAMRHAHCPVAVIHRPTP